MGLTSNQKGAIAETRITAAAIELGMEVYRPIVEGGRYDVILDASGVLLRTQCKWANRDGQIVIVRARTCRRARRGYFRGTYAAHEVDGIPAYCPDTGECYFLPIEIVAGRVSVSLRLAPARNNQERLVHWAADYRLGAIAQLGERLTGSQEVGGSNPPSSTTEGPLT